MCCVVCACAYLGLQIMQQRENGKKTLQGVSHMLLHHLPPDAETDESHQAECLETDSSACLHPAGEPGYSRMDQTKQRMDDRCIVYFFVLFFDYTPEQHKNENAIEFKKMCSIKI